MSLEILKIQHNTPEWLEHRKTGIGGSDAAAILGLSPFKTNVQVWEEKVGIREPDDISENPVVKYGTEAEDPLFRLFCLDHPQYRGWSDKTIVYRRGFMFSSLDGELEELSSGALGVYEGKTGEIHRKSALEKWNKRVPDYYYVQLLHQLVVTGRSFNVLKAQLKLLYTEDLEIITKHYRYERNALLDDLKYLYCKEHDFWGYVQRKERPPLILPRFGKE